jgi:hypothetical protein
MEMMKLAYDDIMKMPSTRRIRMIIKKSDLEADRKKKHDADMARARRK